MVGLGGWKLDSTKEQLGTKPLGGNGKKWVNTQGSSKKTRCHHGFDDVDYTINGKLHAHQIVGKSDN